MKQNINGNDGHHNHPYYENDNRIYPYSQTASNSYPTHKTSPYVPYRQPKRLFPRFPTQTTNNYIEPDLNYPNFQRQRLPNRYPISNYRISNKNPFISNLTIR